jgi:hypothetical protein
LILLSYYARGCTGDNMAFIFDVKDFNVNKSGLLSHLDEINFLGVKDIDGITTFINLRNAEEIVVNNNEIRIEFSDYFYVIEQGSFTRKYYIKE